ncbi:MAG: M28 family peptidase [Candidatus Eisenbacteria sp.]|nr:M28 family peptidase [Candidatus Eisenbacteria bacterium]
MLDRTGLSAICATTAAMAVAVVLAAMPLTLASCTWAPAGYTASGGAPTDAPTPVLTGRPTCNPATLEHDLRFLASDDMEGRALGSKGLQQALQTVAERFRDLGLLPPFPQKASPQDPLAGYFQKFEIQGHPPMANVIGILPGHPEVSPRAVVVGAHADHIGRDPKLKGDQIYNGADDNASGMASLLAIASMMSATEEGQRDRAVIFVVFSGEESGLLGSRHYVDHPVVPHEDVMAMINLDCVGHLRNDQIIVFGTGTAREFSRMLIGLNQAFGFDIVERPEGAGASDHTSFFAKGIPALHFFTGPHKYYNKVTDEADRINFEGLARLTDYVGELVRYLRYRGRPLTFEAVGTEQMAMMEKMAKIGQRKVSLGFMPDFSMASGGVKVGPVREGGVASQAGIEKGDVITAIDGESIDTLIDYSAVLRSHSAGDRITVTVLRANESLNLKVTVQEAK